MPRFEKGHPRYGGRKKGSGYDQRCREFMRTEGWDKLFDTARVLSKESIEAAAQNPEASFEALKLGFSALKLITAYAHGRPREAIDISGAGFLDWLKTRPESGAVPGSGQGKS